MPLRSLWSSSEVAEHWQQVDLDRVSVPTDRRGLAAAILLGEPQVLLCRLGESHTRRGGRTSRRRSGGFGAELLEPVAQPVLREPLREVALSRPPPPGPDRPDLARHLRPIGQPVLGPPGRTAALLEPENEAARPAHGSRY